MMNHILPQLVSITNLKICLESILDKAQFDTVGLVHLNATADIADIVHQQLITDTDYAWIRFDMSDNSTLQHPLLMDNLFTRIFFVFFLDDYIDWQDVFKFFVRTYFDHRDNQIFVVNKYPTIDYLREVGQSIWVKGLYNAATVFWNTSGHGTGIEAYKFDGFQKAIWKVPVDNNQCISDSKMFSPDKMLHLHSSKITIYGQTDPPRIVKTSTMINGKFEHSIGGHDVLIMDEIFKHLNAIPNFKLMHIIVYMIRHKKYEGSYKPDDCTEQRYFNISQITRYNWTTPDPLNMCEMLEVLGQSGIEMNTQQVKYTRFMETLRIKDYTYLYPHDTDNFLIVVPKRFKSKTEYDQILKSPMVLVWGPVIIVATVVRFIFNKIMRTDKSVVDLFLQTFGLSLGMSFNATISTVAENVLLWWFCLGTMLSGMLLSSSMFQGFALQLNILTIRNLKELEMSGLEVQAPRYSETVIHFFENIPQKLNVTYRLDFEISDMIFDRNTSNAYVIREGKFNILFGSDQDVWHVIKRFGFEYLSYKLHFFSGLEDRMNMIVQRCVDHGITNYLIAKNRRLLSGMKPKDQRVISTATESLTISDMKNHYLLYAVGIVLSAIAWIAERIYYKTKISRKKTNGVFRGEVTNKSTLTK